MLLENKKYKLIYFLNEKIAKIGYLGVKKKYQKEGIGKSVVLELFEEFKALGIEKIEIDSYKKSNGFWTKCGFDVDKHAQVIDGHRQDYHSGRITIG